MSCCSALTPEKELQDHKPLYAVHVTQTVDVSTYNMSDVGSARIPNNTSIFDTCEDCFPANLPAGLLPEHGMSYNIPSQDTTTKNIQARSG